METIIKIKGTLNENGSVIFEMVKSTGTVLTPLVRRATTRVFSDDELSEYNEFPSAMDTSIAVYFINRYHLADKNCDTIEILIA